MKTRRQAVIVVAVLLALGLTVAVLAQLNKSGAVVETGELAVTRDGETLRTFTMSDVKALPSVTAKKTILSSSHADEEGDFTGVPLRRLLAEVTPTLLDDATQVITRAVDGYVSALGVDEVTGGDDVLVVYAKDGESLGTDKDGGTGPFRIVILSDTYGNRCTKWLNEIEIQ